MKFCVLASGSKGNVTYIEHKNSKILVDAGLTYKCAYARAMNRDIDISLVDSIYITHEHNDHIGHLPMYLKNTKAKVYIHKESFARMPQKIFAKIKEYHDRIKFIEENARYNFDDYEVLTLKLSHDSASCLGYIFIGDGKRLGIITDTGFFPVKYIEILKTLNSIVIEANHDVELLTESKRIWLLKERILSPIGHMSNHICSQVLQAVINDNYSSIVLAHVSEECNSEKMITIDIINVIEKMFKGEILIAKQHEALKMIDL